ncbi:hypothetical protein N7533_002829 [Penicillium manginii]|uniref:uncharacterized protein n=1 Tax=Penicillium manginii TaxID=203109 RepID=UPI002547C7C9|nr:uncharacterized protein N7533_002829 [Penicillium manginii]KAJ5764148.1 hypothetical protein N7533_002829 [Penicillium manginii]
MASKEKRQRVPLYGAVAIGRYFNHATEQLELYHGIIDVRNDPKVRQKTDEDGWHTADDVVIDRILKDMLGDTEDVLKEVAAE